MRNKHLLGYNRGVSLVETLLYVVLIAVIFLLIVSTVLSFTKSYRPLAANRALEHTAINVLERVTRDIRNASDVTVSGNDLLVTQTVNSVSTTTRFYLQSGVVKVDVNSVYSGPLSVSNSSVTSLTFIESTSTGPSAIKIDMTVQGTSGPVTRTKNFHSTIIAKES